MKDYLKFVHPSIQSIIPYQPGKTIKEIKRTYGFDHVIKLASNENPLGTSPKAIEAMREHLEESASYPEDNTPDLRNYLSELNQIKPSQIIFGCGSSEALDFIIQVFTSAGGNIIIRERAFALYRSLAQTAGADVITVPDNGWEIDLSGILNSIDNNTRIIMFANPNNPIGTWLPFDELQHFIEQVPSHIIVVIDEAYYEYMTDKKYQSAISLINNHPNVIITRTFSKIYGLAGIRIGYAIGHEDVITLLNQVRKPFNVNSLAFIAAYATLQDKNFIEQSLKTNQQGMQLLAEGFAELKLPVIAKSANFLTVKFGQQAEKIAQELLDKGIIVRPLKPYKMPHHLRISIGTEAENTPLLKELRSLV